MPLQHILAEHGAFEVISRSYPSDAEGDCSHAHPGYELYYQQRGSRCLCTEQGSVFLGTGGAALIGSGCVHKTIPADHAPARALVLHFTNAYLAPLRRAMPGAPFTELFEQKEGGPVALAAEGSAFLPETLEQLYALQTARDIAGAARCRLLLAELLLRLGTLPRARPERHGSAEALVRRAKAYIGACYQAPLDLAAVAAWLGVSRGYLSRTFGQQAGISLTRYINGVRVCAAQALLGGPKGAELDLAQIAAQCGFGSIAHFRRVFKAMTGAAPGQYRSAARRAARRGR